MIRLFAKTLLDYILAQSASWTAQRARAAQKPVSPKAEGLGKLAASHIGRLASRVHTDISANEALLTGPESAMDGTIAEILCRLQQVLLPVARMKYNAISSPSGARFA